jgi:hypothetical protein
MISRRRFLVAHHVAGARSHVRTDVMKKSGSTE